MGLELGHLKMEDREFFNVYYNETETDIPNRNRAQSCDGVFEMLSEFEAKAEVRLS